MIKSSQIRRTFLDYFKSKGHEIVPSSPIVVKDDPTLLFTNAGMNQFKDNFLGIKPPKAPRLADTQKCLRVSGKHNDLEVVGRDTYHHTMFEMLGNWSFGNYYKKEAIEWAWDLLVNEYKIDPGKIYVTIFGGDEELGLGVDEEARTEWKKWIAEDRILEFDRKDNFWEMGDVGPCGPCSEIHVDIRTEEEKAQQPGHELVNMDHPQVIEIWNLVFMEFNHQSDGSLVGLPSKNVDTGMGFERLAMVLQDKSSNYDTDVFSPYIQFLEKTTGHTYGNKEETDIAIRVISDHVRAVGFAIADGQLPSSNAAGYVIRRILRRASRYGFTFLGQTAPFIYKLVPVWAEAYRDIFPEILSQVDFIQTTIHREETSFLRTLARGTQLFDDYVREHKAADKTVDGAFAFKLFDTYGFPVDLTELMAEEKGWTVDLAGFDAKMEEQRNRSRGASEVKAGDWVEVMAMDGLPVFTGYDTTEGSTHIARHRTSSTAKGQIYQVVLDQTPFYAESGGQIGDTGTLTKGDTVIKVLDTRKENDLIVHFVDRLPEDASGEWLAEVNAERRRRIRANHSATHLLHAALRQVLGDHVEQRGSYVGAESLRFDFSHPAKMTAAEIAEVEAIVNTKISAGIPLQEHRNIPIADAKSMGAMALFGEKYGETVRVIVFDQEYSIELCGGIHVPNTSEIRLFKLTSESSSAAGIRRIEATTSDQALDLLNGQVQVLDEISALLKNPKDPRKAVQDLMEKHKQLEKELAQLQSKMVGGMKEELLGKAETINGVQLLASVVEVPNPGELKNLAFELLKALKSGVVVLGAGFGEKANLNVAVSKDLTGQFNAGQIIRTIAKEIQGGGGGQPHFAQAGGKNPAGLPAAIAKAKELMG